MQEALASLGKTEHVLQNGKEMYGVAMVRRQLGDLDQKTDSQMKTIHHKIEQAALHDSKMDNKMEQMDNKIEQILEAIQTLQVSS